MEYRGLMRMYGVRKQSIYHHGDAVYVASTITQPTSCNTFIVKLMNEAIWSPEILKQSE